MPQEAVNKAHPYLHTSAVQGGGVRLLLLTYPTEPRGGVTPAHITVVSMVVSELLCWKSTAAVAIARMALATHAFTALPLPRGIHVPAGALNHTGEQRDRNALLHRS